jgi:hypothetical protein
LALDAKPDVVCQAQA